MSIEISCSGIAFCCRVYGEGSAIEVTKIDMKSDDPWFIAREGEQHGPLNESEMQLFVDRGYLRATDLVWRQGFPDWRPAFSVFPPKSQPTQPPAATPAAPTAPNRTLSEPQTATLSPATPNRDAGLASISQSGPRPQSLEPEFSEAPSDKFGEPHGANVSDVSNASAAFGTDPLDDSHKPRSVLRIASTLGAMTIAGLGVWYYVNGSPDWTNAADNGEVPVVKAPATASSKAAATTAVAPPAPVPLAANPVQTGIDQRLQQAELWRFLKSQYPNWYKSVLDNADQLEKNATYDQRLSELLVTRLIELRRRNATNVLAAGPQSLASVASTFLDNLKYLANEGAEPCYNFISKGEQSTAVVSAMLKPETHAPIHDQLLATFKASTEGASTPVKHAAPEKEDYQALTGELAKIGWNKEDIQLFANPKALSEAPPARVCQMVQDWFTAHLRLDNKSAQERLLHETLRPVISG